VPVVVSWDVVPVQSNFLEVEDVDVVLVDGFEEDFVLWVVDSFL
jgi:hypothetical protein